MATCPICGNVFDEQAFQLIVPGLGVFDSVDCVEEARRRSVRRERGELADDLLEAVERVENGSGPTPSPETTPADER